MVWWGTRLLYRRPEWLAEHRPATTPMGRMHWFPFVTFWQVCADMPVCRNVPEGFGHKYHASQITPRGRGCWAVTRAPTTPPSSRRSSRT